MRIMLNGRRKGYIAVHQSSCGRIFESPCEDDPNADSQYWFPMLVPNAAALEPVISLLLSFY